MMLCIWSATQLLLIWQLSKSATMAVPAESSGVTVPTAETAADGVDVEDVVEILSTP